MHSRVESDFEMFADFLFSDAFCDLESSKESLVRFEAKLKEQLERGRKALKKSWIGRASAARTQFEESAKNVVSELSKMYGSRKELMKAIQDGILGGEIKSRLQVQFRNRKIDELSDEELRSIVGDQELLEILKKIKGDK